MHLGVYDEGKLSDYQCLHNLLLSHVITLKSVSFFKITFLQQIMTDILFLKKIAYIERKHKMKLYHALRLFSIVFRTLSLWCNNIIIFRDYKKFAIS